MSLAAPAHGSVLSAGPLGETRVASAGEPSVIPMEPNLRSFSAHTASPHSEIHHAHFNVGDLFSFGKGKKSEICHQ